MSRNIIIIGASGGIGREIVSSYLDEEVCLYLTCNSNQEKLNSLVGKPDKGSQVQIFRADLANPLETAGLTEDLLKACTQTETPKIDALVVAAGIDLMTQESKNLSFDDRLKCAWQIDVASTVHIAREIGAVMKRRQQEVQEEDYKPAIVLFGWDGTERGQEGDTAQIYATCKGAVVAFARSLTQSLAPEVRVNVVSPGWIRTTWGNVASKSSQARVVAESLTGRWGTPKEVANVVRFLLSDSASYLNGQNVALNGGFSYRRKSV